MMIFKSIYKNNIAVIYIAKYLSLIPLIIIILAACNSKEQNEFSIKLLENINEASNRFKPGEQKILEIDNKYLFDIFIISNAYINENYVVEKASKFGLPIGLAKEIVSLSSSQDGTYFYRIKNGNIIEDSPLGPSVYFSDLIVFHRVSKSTIIKLTKKETAYGTLWISIESK